MWRTICVYGTAAFYMMASLVVVFPICGLPAACFVWVLVSGPEWAGWLIGGFSCVFVLGVVAAMWRNIAQEVSREWEAKDRRKRDSVGS